MTRRVLDLALLIALVGLSALHAAGPPPAWQAVGPYGARMTALLADPKRPGVVFAGTDDGLFRSVNGGTTWQAAPQPLQFSTIEALAAGPSSIYASADYGGLFESRDGGASWAHLAPGFGDDASSFVTAVEADPVRATLFIILDDFAGQRELWRSTDGGKHWSAVSAVRSPVRVAADRGASGTFYVGTNFGLIFRTTDGGATWKSSDLSDPLGGALKALAVDPVSHSVYTGGSVSGVFSSTNHGATWRRVILPNELGVDSLTARGGVVYAAASTFILFAPPNNQLFVSSNGGTTWHSSLQGIGNAAIEALAIDPKKPQTVYIGAHSWGVFKSTDAVAHWALSNHGLRGAGVTRIALDPSHPGTILAATDGAGLWKSSDGGQTWKLLNAALGSVEGLALDPRRPATIFAASAGSLQRSRDGGTHWKTLTSGLQSTFITGPLLVDPQRVDTAYVGTTNGVFHSSDGGATWSAPVSGPQCTFPWALVASAAGTVYMGGTPFPGCSPTQGQAGGVFASTDGGLDWEDRGDVLKRNVLSLALDPTGPSTLYAGGFGISFSSGGGATWQDTAPVGPVFSLALGTGTPVAIYAGSRGEVTISADAGASWTHLPIPGAFAGITYDVAYDAAAGRLYAATELGLYSVATP